MAAMPRLTDDEVRDGLAGCRAGPRDGDEIVKVYELPAFMDVIDFVGRIARLAEAADHHPDLDIRYRNACGSRCRSHDAGGITEKDLALAGEIESAAAEGPA